MPDCCLFVSAVFARSAQSGLTVLGSISTIHTVSTVSTVSTQSVCLRTYPFGWLVFVRAKSELSLTICLFWLRDALWAGVDGTATQQAHLATKDADREKERKRLRAIGAFTSSCGTAH
jgi:hypothetical protein